jgi:hypothetical protein
MAQMNDPKFFVKDYLSRNGYPFEMFVAKEFKSAGFEIYQSIIYKDRETGKDREIDVVAYYTRYYKDIQFSFKVLIECKYAKTPWVLFTGENLGFSNLPIEAFYCSNFAGRKLLEVLSSIPTFEFANPFKLEKRVAYGLVETSGSADEKIKEQEKRNNSFKAISTILNALMHEKDKPTQGKIFEIMIPVIAIKGKLFECYLDTSNTEYIDEINEGQFLYKSNIYPQVYPMIEVIVGDKVGELAKKIFEDLDRIYSDHYEYIYDLIDNYPGSYTSVY